ncbi:MAG: tetraacyldisaccharide 4'-kinase [Ignavibacteria bacterium]|nr:tetraacyldisaccharide 4'-kinase [Ignavibacteria bacterium]
MNIYSGISFLRLIFFPISILYGIFILIRNFLYDNDILLKYNSQCKIISIGNINVGGSGKTPLVIKISELLLEKGYKVAIISRGYKRKTKGMQIVYDSKNVILTVDDSGDEPYMIVETLKRKFNNFYFIVSEDRIEAIRYLERNFKPNFILLDDAFQQRRIKKDFDFLVIDINNFQKHKFINKILLPVGNLREPIGNIRRSTAIFENHKFFRNESPRFLKKFNKPIYKIHYTIEGIYNKDYNKIDGKFNSLIAFCGIADPNSFKNALQNYNIKEFITFEDHKYYSENDIKYLKTKYSTSDIFITTEKDFVKIRIFNNFIEKYPVYFIKLDLKIENECDLFDSIISK